MLFNLRNILICSTLLTFPVADPAGLINISEGQGASVIVGQNFTIEQELENLTREDYIKNGWVGFCLTDIKEGKNLVIYNHTKSFIPASNTKILTTAAALDMLGSDFSFKTYFETDAVIKEGVLKGNLYIKGEGDPTLGSSRWKSTADYSEVYKLISSKLKESGIKRIDGSLIADIGNAINNPVPDYWIWYDIGNYYGSAAYPININENMYSLYFRTGKNLGDSTTIVKTDPLQKDISFTNLVTTAAEGSGDNAVIYGAPFSKERVITGTIPRGETFVIKGAIPNPPLYFVNSLKEFLATDGIPVSGSSFVQSCESKSIRKVLFNLASPSLKEIIRETNVYSLNLYAESLLNALGNKMYDRAETASGVKALTEYWKNSQMNTDGLFLFDGSGLSVTNAITPEQLTYCLTFMGRKNSFNDFYNSLPVAGVNGTVSRFGKGTVLENNVRLKSGSLKKVLCYSGYIKTKSGSIKAFSIMLNNYSCPNKVLTGKVENILVKVYNQY